MADEPSIDEILASLDQLLKEGEGRNDEPEEVRPPVDEPVSPALPDAPTPHFFEVLDEEVEAPQAEMSEPASDEPGDGTVQGTESPAVGPGTPDSRLFVLTDAMMVDDQRSLPLGMGGEAAEDPATEAEEAMRQALEMPESDEPEDVGTTEAPAEAPELTAPEPVPTDEVWPEADAQSGIDMEPEADFVPALDEAAEEPAVPTPEPVWDEAQLQALVDQVTDDVCSAIAEQLPDMIRMALAQRLDAFIDTRTKHQDTGSQE